jgi:hypothetical protein
MPRGHYSCDKSIGEKQGGGSGWERWGRADQRRRRRAEGSIACVSRKDRRTDIEREREIEKERRSEMGSEREGEKERGRQTDA